jgi:hypothetical protein
MVICNACGAESEPKCVEDQSHPHVRDLQLAFEKLGWQVTATGAWCATCKDFPR